MANELGNILTSFGCFDDSDVPSLFDDLDALENLNSSDQNLTETNPEMGLASPDYEAEMMSIGSCSPQYQASSPEPDSFDHTYADNVKGNPLMTGAVSPGHESSRGGSVSSDQEESGNDDLLLYLMNETGVSISEIDSGTTQKKQLQQSQRGTNSRSSSTSSANSRGKKRQLDDDDDVPDDQEKNRKNAIAARENRLKKKRYIEGLEKENKSLTSENARLCKDSKDMKEKVSSLEAEVDYLKSVLFNQSALSGLLHKLAPESKVRLSSSFQTRKQPLQKQLLKPGSGGVCLHVNGKDASLEFCAQCALMAEGAPHQL